ncbi:hypothetical protein CR513_10742, partial [Mucuna pruriens]
MTLTKDEHPNPQTYLLLLVGQDMTNGHTLTKTTFMILKMLEKFSMSLVRNSRGLIKAKKTHHISLLRKTTYDGVRGVHEHVMEMVNWFNKLKYMKVELA